MKSAIFTEELNWHKLTQVNQSCLPNSVRSWIYETKSLTRRLRSTYGPEVKVKLISNYWYLPYLTETKQLEIKQRRYALVREVVLHCAHTPLLLARTIIPDSTLKVAHRNLAHLGSRPLGEVIFSYPNLQRLNLEIVQVPLDNLTHQIKDQIKLDQPVWGRRTIYAIQQRPLLVSEFFLPEILQS